MAVPVINVSSVTKSTGITKKTSYTTTIGAGGTTTWTDLVNMPELPSVADGTTVWLSAIGYSNTSTAHNLYSIRVVGVTSGAVVHSADSFGLDTDGTTKKAIPFSSMGTKGIVKATGATENLKIQFKNFGTSTGYFNGSPAWGTGALRWITVNNGGTTNVSLKSTMQITSIDLICNNVDTATVIMCPALGYFSTGLSTVVQTLTPNLMVNELSFVSGRNNDQNGNYAPVEIGYTFTGKELVMS